MRRLPLCLLLFATLSCSRKQPASEFPKIVEDFVYRSLAFSPVNASAQGLHKYEGRSLDTELDNFGGRGLQERRDYYSSVHKKLADLDRAALSAEDQADYDIIDTSCALALFDTDIEKTPNRNPTLYVELIGNALFTPYMQEYAPKLERFRHIIARLEKIQGFLESAQRQLFDAPDPWIKVAIEENQGNVELIDKTLTPACPPELKQSFDKAAPIAKDAIQRFGRFLQNDLPQRRRMRRDQNGDTDPSDWRMGSDMYAIKFKLALATTRTPDEVLQDAKARMDQVRTQMLEIARPLAHMPHDGLSGEALHNAVIGEALNNIAKNHSSAGTYLDDAKKDLVEATAFVRAKNLLPLASNSNLQVIPTPVFMRGIYAVGGFNPAPTLEPQLGAYYWVTPIPSEWPKERAESKLREYNFYKLKLLTIHEAMPGHYVQGEFANTIEPRTRRILRAVYGNNPYIEGWAQYATQTMLDQGFLDNAPELRLTFLKEELRVIANAIIDIQFQSRRMTEAQALDLMEKLTFQEHEEATAKVQRAQLSSTQLPTYFVGWRDWLAVREAVRKQQGAAFDLSAFHAKALREGAVPLPVLQRLLTAK